MALPASHRLARGRASAPDWSQNAGCILRPNVKSLSEQLTRCPLEVVSPKPRCELAACLRGHNAGTRPSAGHRARVCDNRARVEFRFWERGSNEVRGEGGLGTLYGSSGAFLPPPPVGRACAASRHPRGGGPGHPWPGKRVATSHNRSRCSLPRAIGPRSVRDIAATVPEFRDGSYASCSASSESSSHSASNSLICSFRLACSRIKPCSPGPSSAL